VTGLAPGSPSQACARTRGTQAPGAARRPAALAAAPEGSQGLVRSSLLAPDATRRIPGATDVPHAVRATWRAVAGSTALQTAAAPGTTPGCAGTRTTDRPVAQQQRAAGMALPGARAAALLPGRGPCGAPRGAHAARPRGCRQRGDASRCVRVMRGVRGDGRGPALRWAFPDPAHPR
jgi:hypothetical protein